MKVKRWAIKVALLGVVLAALGNSLAMAEYTCYEFGDCTYCFYYNGDVYAGHLKWCRPAV